MCSTFEPIKKCYKILDDIWAHHNNFCFWGFLIQYNGFIMDMWCLSTLAHLIHHLCVPMITINMCVLQYSSGTKLHSNTSQTCFKYIFLFMFYMHFTQSACPLVKFVMQLYYKVSIVIFEACSYHSLDHEWLWLKTMMKYTRQMIHMCCL